MTEVQETLAEQMCGAPTEKGPCTMKKGHRADFHRHQIYDTVEWAIYDANDDKFIVNGTGRLGLQYGLNTAFAVADEIIIKAKNANSSNSNSDSNGGD